MSAGGVPEGYADYVADKLPTPLALPSGIPEKDGSTVYDYKFEVAHRSWKLWIDTIEKLSIPDNAQFSDIIIPTKDSAR